MLKKYLVALSLLSMCVYADDATAQTEESGKVLKDAIEKAEQHLSNLGDSADIKEFLGLLKKFDSMNDARHQFSAALKKLIEDSVVVLAAMAESVHQVENIKKTLGGVAPKDDADRPGNSQSNQEDIESAAEPDGNEDSN